MLSRRQIQVKPDTPFSTTSKIPAKTITSSRSSMLFDDVVTTGTPGYRKRTYFLRCKVQLLRQRHRLVVLEDSNTNLVLRTERKWVSLICILPWFLWTLIYMLSIPPISTKRTITAHLNSLNTINPTTYIPTAPVFEVSVCLSQLIWYSRSWISLIEGCY